MSWNPHSWRAPLVRAAGNGFLHALVHITVLLGGYEIYRAISIEALRVPSLAHDHAAALIALEHRLGLLIEPRVQNLALHHGSFGLSGLLDGAAVRHLSAIIYAGSQLYWLAAMLLWLYLFQRKHFTYVRNLVVATTLLAGTFSAVYAVAPPRFAMAGAPYWMEDALHPFQSELLLVHQAAMNPYASLPSNHTLWALLTGLGLALGAATVTQRRLAMVFPAAIMLTVVITGNHYVFDCLGALLLLVVCIGCGWLVHRLEQRRKAGSAPAMPAIPARGRERRKNPNMRPLDHPLILCATIVALLAMSPDSSLRLIAAALLICAAIMLPLARHRARIGIPLRAQAISADWWCGFLFVSGSTAVGSEDALARACGSLLWAGAALLPLIARMRSAAQTAAPATSMVERADRPLRAVMS